MKKLNQPHRRQSRNEKKKREFLNILHWLDEEGQQATSDFENYWRMQYSRWVRWQQLDRKMLSRRPGLTEDMTGTNSAEVYAWRRSFYYAKQRRYIETQKRGDRLIIALTDAGRRTLIRHAVARAPKLPTPWIILVLFDIPEQARQSRNLLRAFLHEHGYRQFQKSAWYTTNDTQEHIQYFLAALDIEKWVTVIRAQCSLLYRKR